MLIFVIAEVMFFGGLISAHTIVRTTALNGWPPGQPRLPIQETLINTAALIASGFVLRAAHRAYERELGGARAKRPLLVAMLLGLFFVGFQGMEWAALLREGLGSRPAPTPASFT